MPLPNSHRHQSSKQAIQRSLFSDQAGVTVFTMTEIDKYGMREIMGRALSLAGADTPGVHVSFDVDVIDPTEAPGVGDPVPPGSHLRESGTLSLRTAGT